MKTYKIFCSFLLLIVFSVNGIEKIREQLKKLLTKEEYAKFKKESRALKKIIKNSQFMFEEDTRRSPRLMLSPFLQMQRNKEIKKLQFYNRQQITHHAHPSIKTRGQGLE